MFSDAQLLKVYKSKEVKEIEESVFQLSLGSKSWTDKEQGCVERQAAHVLLYG